MDITFQYSRLEVLIRRVGFPSRVFPHNNEEENNHLSNKRNSFSQNRFSSVGSFLLIWSRVQKIASSPKWNNVTWLKKKKKSQKTSLISTQHAAKEPAEWSQIRFISFSWEFKGVRPNNSEQPTIKLFLSPFWFSLQFLQPNQQAPLPPGGWYDMAGLLVSNYCKKISETCFDWGFKEQEIEQH